MTVIDVKEISKTYLGAVPVKAVDNISFSIEEGEFTAIVGPSGCGKTTLLNLLGGLDSISSGSILVGDAQMNQMSASELTEFRLYNIGFVFQSYNLVPVLTAAENAGFILELQGAKKSFRERRVRELFSKFGIEDKFSVRPSLLSGGQQQRVAVARALASKPRFVLADEPTANLDSKATAELLDLMLKMNQEENVTILFATHDDRVIQRARRVISLTDGKIVSDTETDSSKSIV